MQAGLPRLVFTAAAAGLAAVIVVFPPWRARAIRTTVRYDATPGIAPATLIDTVRWTLAFAPLYAHRAPRYAVSKCDSWQRAP